ncbi:MAG: hypothetical protein JXJ04_06395 [Spirochaetales bacterium]|nr:hypothetical protein [Spirochaetales bacterium]
MKILYIFLLILTVLLFSCDLPETDDGQRVTASPTPTTELTPNPTGEPIEEITVLPPETVEADFVDAVPQVVWSSVDLADTYEIYRQDGVGEYRLTGTVEASAHTFADPGFPRNVSFNYTVVSKCGHYYSRPSKPSNNLSKYIRNLEATKLEYTDRIIITWQEAYNADNYRVFRYLSKDEEPLVIGETDTPGFADTFCKKNVLYYYRVTWDSHNTEYGTGGPFADGICSDYIDFYEPNDRITDIENQQISTVFVRGQPPYIFSFYDNSGGTSIDTDWYKYSGPPRMICIKVSLPFDSVFNEHELFFRFYYNNSLQPEQPLYAEWTDMTQNEWGRTFIFDNFDTHADTMELYYTIYPLLPTTIHKFGSYRIEISDEL